MIWLWSDLLLWAMVASALLGLAHLLQSAPGRYKLYLLFNQKRVVFAAVLLAFYVVIALLDSIHWVDAHHHTISVLDVLFNTVIQNEEVSYSAPFATQSLIFAKATVAQDTAYPLLVHTAQQSWRTLQESLWLAIGVSGIAFMVLLHCVPHKTLAFSLGFIVVLITFMVVLVPHWHVLGTNKIGEDVLYLSLKGVRTGMLIGVVTTWFMLPFALGLGILAGYCKGWVDDVIQYIYTTLSAIPGVLLIAASLLTLQNFFEQALVQNTNAVERADSRLLLLCALLGVMSWTTLCRLVRAQTLQIKELEYVNVARNLQMPLLLILKRQILPNILPLVLITVILDFSGLVLAEAVLSYLGIGVDPASYSWGTMINGARLEMVREPSVWWTLCGAFVGMFGLVLSVNLLADGVQKVWDPKRRVL